MSSWNEDPISQIAMATIKATIAARDMGMLVGDPGTGKTEKIYEVCESMEGYELITLLTSQMEPSDILGNPKATSISIDGHEVQSTVFLAPEWQIRTLIKKKVILFFDEFGNAPPSVRAALLTFFQNRRFANGIALPEETIIIGAMNPVENGADGYELDQATTNRMVFIPWKPSNESFFVGMSENWGKPCSEKEMMWKRRIVGFLRDNPAWVHRPPQAVETSEVLGVAQNDYVRQTVLRSAWASRRSWDRLSKLLAQTDDDDVKVQDSLAVGRVGYAASVEFRSWLAKHDVIHPADVLSSPNSVDWSEMTLDNSNFILSSIIEMIDSDNAKKAIQVFLKIAKDNRCDLGAPYVQDLIAKTCVPSIDGYKDNRKMVREVTTIYADYSKNSL